MCRKEQKMSQYPAATMEEILHLPAAVSLTDPLIEAHQGAAWMALQDAETYLGYLAEKIKDANLAEAIKHIKKAHEAFRKVEI